MPNYQSALLFNQVLKATFGQEATEQEKSALIQLLTLLEAPDNPSKLRLVLEGYESIAFYAGKVCAGPKWRWAKKEIMACLPTRNAIWEKKEQLGRINPDFTKGPGTNQNQSLRKIAGHPLYSTLGYRPSELDRFPHYHHLQCHALVACLVLQRTSSLSVRATTQIKEDALVAVRALAGIKYDSELRTLPESPLTPEQFLLQIRRLPGTFRIHEFGKLIELAMVRNEEYYKEKSLDATTPIELAPEENEDEFIPWDVLGDLKIRIPTPQETTGVFYYKRAFPSGDIPLGQDLVLIPAGNPHSLFNITQASKRLAKDNQLLSIAWHELTGIELGSLIQSLCPEKVPQDLHQSMGIACLHLMLWAGLDSMRIANLRIDHEQECDGYDPRTGILRLVSRGPKLSPKNNHDAQLPRIARQNHIDLALPDCASKAIEHYLTTWNSPLHAGRLVPFTTRDITASCQKHIRTINKATAARLTLNRIQNYHFRALTRMPTSDISSAALTLGRENEYLARTKVHYSSFDEFHLQEIFRESCSKILSAAGFDAPFQMSYPPESTLHVGTLFRPKPDAIRATTQSMRNRLESLRSTTNSIEQLVDFHNLYSAYTGFLIAYGTGYRRSGLPHIESRLHDRATGFACIRDKDTADYYHSRLVWLTPTCEQQLEHYREHIANLLAHIELEPAAQGNSNTHEIPEFFFLTKNLTVDLDAKTFYAILRQHGYHYPGHPQRHLLKSELQEAGCDAEVVELFLGHWNLGQEAWVNSSTLHPSDFKNELAKFLPALQRRLDFTPLKGLLNPQHFAGQIILGKPHTPQKKISTSASAIDLHENPPGRIWFEVLAAPFQGKPLQETFSHHQLAVLHYLAAHQPKLYSGEKPSLDDRELEKLMDRIAPAGLGQKERYKRLIFLTAALDRGNRYHDWQLKIPYVPKILTKPKNRVSPAMMRRLHKTRKLEEYFLRSVEKPIPQSPRARLGQILLSAILYGGLCQKTWVSAFPRGLNHIYQHGDWMWIDLWHSDKDDKRITEETFRAQANPSDYRRWVVDPMTQVLLYRWMRKAPDELGQFHSQQPWHALTDFFSEMGIPRHIQPNSLGDFLQKAKSRYTLTFPPALIAYADGSLPSACLPDPIWLRTMTGMRLPIQSGRNDSRPMKKKSATYNLAIQLDLLKELIRLLGEDKNEKGQHQKKIEAIDTYINDNEGKVCTTLYLLASWAKQLLGRRASPKERRKTVQPLAVSTVQDYVGQIGREILTHSIDVNLLDCDEEDYRSFYERVAREIKSDENSFADKPSEISHQQRYNYKISRLNQFHKFLEVFFDQPSIQVENLLEKDTISATTSVSANFIAIKDYQNILGQLGFGRPSHDLIREQRMGLAACILAYGTGMRHREIIGLRIGDVQDDGHCCEVLVQANEFRALKTDSAFRRLPLHVLLSEKELANIREWLRQRKAETKSLSAALFTSSPFADTPPGDDRVFAHVRSQIKNELIDQSAVIHHCRDSFANNHFIKMMVRDDIHLNTKPYFFDSLLRSQENQKGVRKELLHEESTSKKALFTLALLLGHADIDEAMRSYVHLTDFLLGYFSRHKDHLPKLSMFAIQELSQCSSSHAYKLEKEENPLTEILKNQYQEFSDRLKHPFIETSLTHSTPKTINKTKKGLPHFDAVISRIDKKNNKIFSQKHLNEIKLTQKFYEKIQSLKYRQQKNLIIISEKIYKNLIDHGEYIQITSRKQINDTFCFLKMIWMDSTNVDTTFHASRYLSEKKKERVRSLWEKSLEDDGIIFQEGKDCQIRDSSGCIRIRLGSSTIKKENKEILVLNYISLKFLCHIIAFASSADYSS